MGQLLIEVSKVLIANSFFAIVLRRAKSLHTKKSDSNHFYGSKKWTIKTKLLVTISIF